MYDLFPSSIHILELGLGLPVMRLHGLHHAETRDLVFYVFVLLLRPFLVPFVQALDEQLEVALELFHIPGLLNNSGVEVCCGHRHEFLELRLLVLVAKICVGRPE